MEQGRIRLLGLYACIQVAGLMGAVMIRSGALVDSSTAGSFGSLQIFGMVLIATALMLLLVRYGLKKLLRLWFDTSMLMTGFIYLSVFFSGALALGMAVAGAVLRRHVPSLWTRNGIDGLSFAGAGLLFGLLVDLRTAVLLILIIGIYDVVAVYLTEHMVQLATASMESGAFAGLMYPKDGDTATTTTTPSKGDESSGGAEVGIIGGGDIVIPLMLAVAATNALGVVAGLGVAAGATLGLVLLFEKSSEESFYPAIPAVGGGGLLGLGLVLLAMVL